MAIRGEKKKGCSFLLLLNVSEEELLPVSSIFLRAIPASLTTDLLQNSSCNFGKSVQISRMGTMLTFIIFSFTCQKTGEGRIFSRSFLEQDILHDPLVLSIFWLENKQEHTVKISGILPQMGWKYMQLIYCIIHLNHSTFFANSS